MLPCGHSFRQCVDAALGLLKPRFDRIKVIGMRGKNKKNRVSYVQVLTQDQHKLNDKDCLLFVDAEQSLILESQAMELDVKELDTVGILGFLTTT